MEERVFELKASILKVFGQPTRMKILECLRDGENPTFLRPIVLGGGSKIGNIPMKEKNS
jgi:hypothetical protein